MDSPAPFSIHPAASLRSTKFGSFVQRAALAPSRSPFPCGQETQRRLKLLVTGIDSIEAVYSRSHRMSGLGLRERRVNSRKVGICLTQIIGTTAIWWGGPQ